MRSDPQTLQRLEWDEFTRGLSRLPRTPLGRQACEALRPLESAEQIERAQQRVEEMRLHHAGFGALPLSEVVDPRPALEALRVAGRSLDGETIYQLLHLLLVAREVADVLRELDPDRSPALGGEWARFPDLSAVTAVIGGNLSSTGELEDGASPELARIRREIRQLSERLTGTLNRLIEAEWTDHVLRDRYITVRNDRFVLPVRTDAPRRFHGIVHGSSSTDKTLFVEPLETVEINNRLVGLKNDQKAEEERILAAYSELLRTRMDEIAASGKALADLDLLDAIAAWAEREGACRPELSDGGGFRLEGARHPLLAASLAAERPPRPLVPLDVDLPRDLNVLVISGPNAGGKTVALKTVGLLALMAHAGLPLPARSARLPYFEALHADIGDEQSLEGGLSTFSSHIQNLAQMVREAGQGTLLLVDEIGTGTDPAEGAALGTAILDHLLERGVHVVATTHHQAIKTWAYRTSRVLNAACAFDEQTMRPAYRLVAGVAGASVGLTMAEQLGLDPTVVARARQRLDPTGAEATEALESVRELAEQLERQREEVTERRRELERSAREQMEKSERLERKRREEWQRRLDEVLRSFREEARRMIGRLTDSRERRALDRERARRERELKERFAEELHAARQADPLPDGWQPATGEAVYVVSLGREGKVAAIRGSRVEVNFGRTMFTVAAGDLRPVTTEGRAARESETGAAVRRARTPTGVSAELTERPVAAELHLLGYRVEEALTALERYIDDVRLAELPEVRIVHGVGTGRLRQAVRGWLDQQRPPLGWREAAPAEGGAGATVVRLESEV